MNKTSYVSRPVDENGVAAYTEEDNAVWRELITRQKEVIKNRACDEYLNGLRLLNLPEDRVPQCHEVTKVLQATTGWALEPVPAIIPFDHFFHLLANRKFPAATFIRKKEEINYVKEPDIFHEIFGHCPQLTNPAYAEFTHTYGKLGLNATPHERVMLARLIWFTIEFGLVQTGSGIRAYGGGILSSINETVYCIESKIPQRKPFDPIDALRTPYRIDILQPVYFVLKNFEQLFHVIDGDIMSYIRQAESLGEYMPLYTAEE